MLYLLAQVRLSADRNVLMLRRLSCSSTLPIFVAKTKDGWLIFEPKSCEEALPLPTHEAANRIASSAMNLE